MTPICPHCVQVHDFDRERICPLTGHEVPASYLTEYERWPPLWLATAGFKGHGKTTFLGILTLVIEYLQNLPGILVQPLDGHSAAQLRRFRRLARSGWEVESTEQALPRPLLLHAEGLTTTGRRTLVVYDLAGESFSDFDSLEPYAAALRHVTTVWFFVSLADLAAAGDGRGLQDLFSTYLEGCRRLGIDVAGRNLVVVFTKADADERLQRTVGEHLRSDPLRGCLADAGDEPSPSLVPMDAEAEEALVEGLIKVSERLEAFARRDLRAGGFVNLVQASGMRLVFTAVSALGDQPIDGRLAEAPNPSRVLDPLFWAGALDVPSSTRHVHLVLDAASPEVFAAVDIEGLWRALARVAEVTVSQLGRPSNRTVAGSPPPSEATTRNTARLIVPLLARTEPAAAVVVIAALPIVDLADLEDSEWPHRMLFVGCGHEPLAESPWVAIDPALPIERIVERTLQMTGGR